MSKRDLIARLEAATEGSRELDGMIALAAGAERFRNWWDDEARTVPAWHVLWTTERGWLPLPHYTGILDAALTLVPEGFAIDLHYFPPTTDVPAGKYFNAAAVLRHIGKSKKIHADGHTICLALCSAILRAMEANDAQA